MNNIYNYMNNIDKKKIKDAYQLRNKIININENFNNFMNLILNNLYDNKQDTNMNKIEKKIIKTLNI